jgi:dTDP-4-amino-4,6-dideoxygalactose transaminase
MNIPFNKPFLTGKVFENVYNFKKCLLTTSCTDALEMAAILIDIQPGDEVILPSYTFVSTANAFVLRGAKLIFADSMADNPNMDVATIEPLITEKTKAIVPVHYAGVACDMDAIMELASKYGLWVVEDAAQAIDSFYVNAKGERFALGSIGHLAAFSFHETKNIISGEGGMLAINDNRFLVRSEIIWEKGTNRSSFFRGEVDKYGWVDIGSSFLPSEIIAAFLWAQLENVDLIQKKRILLWEQYFNNLQDASKLGHFNLPLNSEYSTNNGHMFYVVVNSLEIRTQLIDYLKSCNVLAVFHYISLNKSPFNNDGIDLVNSDRFTNCLVRLPLYYELELTQVDFISGKVIEFFNNYN